MTKKVLLYGSLICLVLGALLGLLFHKTLSNKPTYISEKLSPSDTLLIEISNKAYHNDDTTYILNGTCYYQEKIQKAINGKYNTSSGMKIDKYHILASRTVALPQYMLKEFDKKFNHKAPFKYGDTIMVSSNDKNFPYWGMWIVRDCTIEDNKVNLDFAIACGDIINIWHKIRVKRFKK